ncbi:hypothetical protein CDO73_02630 [Saccharibacillus sp. O23]|uniref:hypothetical protein n=1 Tax=Saccharibacillus sp. O23 TaxID=2009338 RepID=UPI000B4E5552|nr:hypothetical protein [Saccharibacillus sp. O23]OWR32518.1 hypothetical protein CDO73_02630 [Saccharibacillus sp. O23]
MHHGNRFMREYPAIKDVFEKLYFKRQADKWYIDTCKRQLSLPEDLYSLEHIVEIKAQHQVSPSNYFYIKLPDVKGEGGFCLSQEIQLIISKIVPVYTYDLVYLMKHDSLKSDLDMSGSSSTLEMIETETSIRSIMEKAGYLLLNHEYDLYDTVYEWSELERIDPVNRRLILKDAAFVDILELCP